MLLKQINFMNIQNIIDKKALKNLKQDFIDFIKIAILLILTLFLFEITLGTVCYWQIFFNIPCPFCNITTAFLQFVTFNFKESFQTHPLLPLVFLNVLAFIFSRYTIYKKVFYILFFISFFIFILFYFLNFSV